MPYIHVQHFLPFYHEIKFHCVGMLHVIYPFSGQWTFGLFHLGPLWMRSHEHLCTSFCVETCFPFSWVWLTLNISQFEDLSLDCFPKWLHHFIFPLATYEGFRSPSPSPTLVTVFFLIVAILMDVKWYFIVILVWSWTVSFFFLNNLKNGFCFDIRSAYWTFLEIELNTKVELSNMGTWLCEKWYPKIQM